MVRMATPSLLSTFTNSKVCASLRSAACRSFSLFADEITRTCLVHGSGYISKYIQDVLAMRRSQLLVAAELWCYPDQGSPAGGASKPKGASYSVSASHRSSIASYSSAHRLRKASWVACDIHRSIVM